MHEVVFLKYLAVADQQSKKQLYLIQNDTSQEKITANPHTREPGSREPLVLLLENADSSIIKIAFDCSLFILAVALLFLREYEWISC